MFVSLAPLPDCLSSDVEKVYLGPWCQEKAESNENLISSPYLSTDLLKQSHLFVDEVEARILPKLAAFLNKELRVSFSIRYWKIVVGPWLQRFIHVAYDRYLHIKDALKKVSSFETFLLDQDSFTIPYDYSAFITLINMPSYNWQLCSMIIKAMGHSFPTKKIDKWKLNLTEIESPLPCSIQKAIKENYLALFKFDYRHEDDFNQILNPFSQYYKKLDSHFPPESAPKERLYSKVRTKLSSYIESVSEFESILSRILHKSLPLQYFEHFSYTRNTALTKVPLASSVFSTAHGWYSHELFQIFAAESAENGARLISWQAGGANTSFQYFPQDDHEKSICDAFISWKKPSKEKGLIFLPSIYTSTLLQECPPEASFIKEIVFFEAGPMQNQMRWFQSSPYSGGKSREYYNFQKCFLSSLSKELRSNLIYRRKNKSPYNLDFHNFFKSNFPEINFQFSYVANRGKKNSKNLFVDSLSTLFVFDHISTGFFESLSANKPTILFLKPSIWQLVDKAESLLGSLKRHGFYFTSAEKAAKRINDDSEAIFHQWLSPEVQKIREELLSHFAQAKLDWKKRWRSFFANELQTYLNINPLSATER